MPDARMKTFSAWLESWEEEGMTQKTDLARRLFAGKYMGMKMRVSDEEGRTDIREVVDIVWDNTHRAKGWRLTAALVKEGQGVEETKGAIDDSITLRVKDAFPFIIDAQDLNPNYRIKMMG